MSSLLLGLHQPFLYQAAIELLDVGVDAFVVRNTHAHHVVHLQKWGTVSKLPERRLTEQQSYLDIVLRLSPMDSARSLLSTTFHLNSSETPPWQSWFRWKDSVSAVKPMIWLK